jgi:hypothetical protein
VSGVVGAVGTKVGVGVMWAVVVKVSGVVEVVGTVVGVVVIQEVVVVGRGEEGDMVTWVAVREILEEVRATWVVVMVTWVVEKVA